MPCVFVPSHRGGRRRRRNASTATSASASTASATTAKTESIAGDNRARHSSSPGLAPTSVGSTSLPPLSSFHSTSTPAPAPLQVPKLPPLVSSVPMMHASSSSNSLSEIHSFSNVLVSIQNTLSSLQQQIDELRNKQNLAAVSEQHLIPYTSEKPQSSASSASSASSSSSSSSATFHGNYPISTAAAATAATATATATAAAGPEVSVPLPSTALPSYKFALSSFPVSDVELQVFDLPSIPMIMFFIDTFYDCFHPEFAFMLPKPYFLQSLHFETDAAMLQAMLAISCRFTSRQSAQRPSPASTLPSYMTDPMYWISRAEKWMSSIKHPIAKLQTALLLAFSATYDGHRARAHDLLMYAVSIVELHRLDFIDSPVDASGRYTLDPTASAQKHAELLSSQVDRESFRRTYHMIWELRVLTSTIWSTPQEVPNFTGRVHVPCCEVTYGDGMRDWNGKTFSYDDFADALFSDLGPFIIDGTSPLGVVKKRWRFNSACFRLASVKMLAETAARLHDLTEKFVEETDRCVRILLSKVYGYRTGPAKVHMTLFLTHEILFTTLLLLHRTPARDRLVFVVQPTPYDGLVTYAENSIALVRSAASSPMAMRSFSALKDATIALLDMINVLIECRGGREDTATLMMGPFMGFSLGLCIPVIASQIVLDGVQLPSLKLVLGDFSNAVATLSDTNSREEDVQKTKPTTTTTTTKTMPQMTSHHEKEERTIIKSDLEFCLRCMEKLGRVWKGLRHEYEEGIALMGRMEKVM